MTLKPAPVIFFAYTRHESALRALTSLAENELAGESDLYIFSDGPKPGSGQHVIESIAKTRHVIRSRKWSRNVYIYESETNKGLARSVIEGVTEITKKYGKAIIVEDDALLSPFFLRFMNDALNIYYDEEKVFGIGGWTYFLSKNKISKPFFLRYPDSLTWGIFERSWKLFIQDAATAKKLLEEKNQMQRFNPFDNLHFFDSMLEDQINKKIDSWAIRWTATTVLHNGLILYPPVSMARNMGNTDGTHEQVEDYNLHLEIADKPVIVEKQLIEEDRTAFKEWKRFAKIHFLHYNAALHWKSKIKSAMPAGLKRFFRRVMNRAPARPGINPADLLTVEPVSRQFGLDRGTPIDRYYIHKFLQNNRQYIKGHVLEIGESYYSKQFDNGITSFEVLNYQSDKDATIIGDLTRHDTLPENRMDCFICTQTLNFIYDTKAAMQGCHRLLKPGGVLLLTVAGICQISQYDNKRWGDYWRFTSGGLQKAAEEVFGSDTVNVQQYGNCHSAVLMLKGYAVEDTNSKLLDVMDDDYPVTITLVAIKKNTF